MRLPWINILIQYLCQFILIDLFHHLKFGSSFHCILCFWENHRLLSQLLRVIDNMPARLLMELRSIKHILICGLNDPLVGLICKPNEIHWIRLNPLMVRSHPLNSRLHLSRRRPLITLILKSITHISMFWFVFASWNNSLLINFHLQVFILLNCSGVLTLNYRLQIRNWVFIWILLCFWMIIIQCLILGLILIGILGFLFDL